jgi:RNA polymerase sigma-70 factor (ECF subfamily)
MSLVAQLEDRRATMRNETERGYDALLVVRYQTGDDLALDELIRRYELRVRAGVVRWLGGNSSAVDDLCQQVWIAVVKGLARLDQPMAFQAWLGRIIRSQVALFLRRRERRKVPLDTICDPEDHQLKIPEEPLDWDRLENAIRALGEPYASMLHMRFWDSWSYQQIADALQIPVGTVGSRLHWARSQLAKQLRCEET